MLAPENNNAAKKNFLENITWPSIAKSPDGKRSTQEKNFKLRKKTQNNTALMRYTGALHVMNST